jgi:peptide/nickel transport system ATP-binding protein
MYVHELSGGMAQRVSIVLQLISEPELLILDEPTSALDLPLANLIMLKLKNYSKQKRNSVLLISQDLELTEKYADNIFVILNNTLSQTQSIKEAEKMLQQSYSIK